MAYVSKQALLDRLVLRERDEPSPVFGGDVRLRELLRSEYRDAAGFAGEGVGSLDRWNAALFCAGVIDPETHQPLFTTGEVMAWPNRPDLWDEVLRIAQAVLDLSEVGEGPLKSDDQAPAAE